MANYLSKQASGYVFRFRVPRQAGQGELRFSLKTRDRLLAQRRAADVALRIRKDLSTMPQLTREQIRDLVSEYVRDTLDSIKDYIVHRRPMDPDSHQGSLEALSGYLYQLQEGLALNQLDQVQPQVDAILDQHGLSASLELRRELAHAILSESVRLGSVQLEAMRTGRAPVDVSSPGTTTNTTPGVTFGSVLEAWWKKQAKAWSKRTLVDYQHIREVVEAELGLRPINTLKPTHIEAFGRKLTAERLTAKTVNKYLGFVSSILKYAVKLDYVQRNVASGMALAESKASAQGKREAFTHDDLGRLFGDEWRVLKAKDPAKYWVPLLAAYSGCRLEELCQLYLDDIQADL